MQIRDIPIIRCRCCLVSLIGYDTCPTFRESPSLSVVKLLDPHEARRLSGQKLELSALLMVIILDESGLHCSVGVL
jgi:hypothetical protein